jgi:hypothetical protein
MAPEASDKMVDLLLRWEDYRTRGEVISPENLCRSCPEYLGQLRAEMNGLEHLSSWLDETTPEDPPSSVLELNFPGYQVMDYIGGGGMADVWKARQLVSGLIVALKVPRGGKLSNPKLVERFHREIKTLALLRHKYVVPLYDARVRDDGQPYFAMQYVPGGSVDKQLARFRLDPKATAGLMAKVAQAVHHAHGKDVIHRDLKPLNILLDEQGEPLVSDFGLAKYMPLSESAESPAEGAVPPARADAETVDPGPGSTRRATRGAGTRAYMAPEFLNKHWVEATRAGDIWALGVILYEMLAPRRPFEGPNEPELCQRILEAQPAPLRTMRPELDPWLARIVHKCLEKQPEDRYTTAAELADDLQDWLERRPWWIKVLRVALWVTPPAALAALLFVAIFWPDRQSHAPAVPPSPYLAPTHALDAQKEKVLRSTDESVELATSTLALFEIAQPSFFPFQISIEIRHDNNLNLNGEVGIFLANQRIRTDRGEQQVIGTFAFSDHRPENQYQCIAALHHFCDPWASTTGQKPYSQQQCRRFEALPLSPRRNREEFRTLVVNLGPDQASATIDAVPIGILVGYDYAAWLDDKLGRGPSPERDAVGEFPAGSVGLYLRGCTATFRNLRVERP